MIDAHQFSDHQDLQDTTNVTSISQSNQNPVFLTQKTGHILEHQSILPQPETCKQVLTEKQVASTSLIRKRNELAKIQTDLDEKRAQYQKRMDLCKDKYDILQVKQRTLRERVLKFDLYLRENQAKRQRAAYKAVADRKILETKGLEIQSLQAQIRNSLIQSDKLKKLIDIYVPNEKYLTQVIQNLPSDYLDVQEPQINDILQRYRTLSETSIDLQRTLQSSLQIIEQHSNQLNELQKHKNDQILVLNSQLGLLQKQFDKAQVESIKLDAIVSQNTKAGIDRMQTLSEMKLAIRNIYNHGISCLQLRKGSTCTSSSVEPTKSYIDQLSAIQEQLMDLNQIVTTTEQLIKEEEIGIK